MYLNNPFNTGKKRKRERERERERERDGDDPRNI